MLGDIGPVHKGSGVMRDLARHLRETGAAAAIKVFGAWLLEAPEPKVELRGRYKVAGLPELMASEGIDAMLFPSTCPET